MTETTLAQALGGVITIPQFFIYKLTWDAAKSKYQKKPCYKDGTPLLKDEGGNEATWTDYTTATTNLAALRARDGHNAWTLGWWFTEGCGYWFLDADSVVKDGGELTAEAAYFFQALPGAFCEWSSSGRGLHFVGRGLVPPHSSCPAVAKAVGLEFYTEGRGIAFGLTDKATGSADVDHTAAISVITAHWFKPNALASQVRGVDPAYRGPYDDGELLRRALQSGSTNSLLSGKASFADLWSRNVPVLAKTYPTNEAGKEFGESEADEALAFMLAFWTGRDAQRVERLMQQSALKRSKWDVSEHATYLANTISKACNGCSNVYVEQERAQQMPVATTEDARANSDAWQQKVLQADELALRNEVVPGIAADRSIDMLDRERLAGLVKQRFADFLINLSIGQCRKMVRSEKVVEELAEVGVPAFATEHVYVGQGDIFFHVPTATTMTRTTFQATYNRAMPTKQNGDKEDAAKWCLERWNMETVYDAMYLPGRESIFTHAGRQYANLYSESSIPPVAPYTPEGIKGIHTFARHLELFCGSRPEVYGGVLAWMAYNVQNPGKKVRYAPVLKGIPGDGKSLLVNVMRAAMGSRNVSAAGPSIVMNSGGFTDWAHGACVIGMEELWMQGKARYAVANAIKENVTNDDVTINRKGKGHLPIINISNFICFTNHGDAIPLEDEDRRWWIIFSPFERISDVARAHGVQAMAEVYDVIWNAVHHHAGELRAWLLSTAIPSWFDPNGHAPWTPEKESMRGSGDDEDHAIARQIIEAGAYGVSKMVLSSACLTKAMQAVCIMEGVELPKGKRVKELLNDLGYRWMGSIKWKGGAHRVWARNSVSQDSLKDHLDRTVTVTVGVPVQG